MTKTGTTEKTVPAEMERARGVSPVCLSLNPAVGAETGFVLKKA